MLTADQLDSLTDPVVALYQKFMDSVLVDIARRVGNLDFAKPTAAWQMQRLVESGMVYEDALERVAALTHQSEGVLRELFEKAGVTALRFDDAIYRAAGLNPLALNLSPAMGQVLAAGLRKTNGVMRNLTLSTALDAQNAFIDAADLAYMQVATGAFDYNTAIRNAVTDLADRGLKTVVFPGREDQLDVAVRRAVLTGVNQTAGELQWQRADEMGSDLVEVSAHPGARPTHVVWQGQVFSRSGTHKKYKPFIETTGYGTAGGLMGVNCRHNFYPFFEGLSDRAYSKAELEDYAHKTVTYNGKEMSLYDATQQQRGIERKIREWKRRRDVLTAAGQEAGMETAKVKEWQGRMRDFTRQTGLQRQPEREWVGRGSGTKKELLPGGGGASVGGGSPKGEELVPVPDQDFFDWEMREMRGRVTTPLTIIDPEPYGSVAVPKNVYQKIMKDHSSDFEYLEHLGEVINSWEHIGISPKDAQKIEFYKKINDIWFTAVVKRDQSLQVYILTTFHRIYKRKLEKRIESGYLISK